MWQNFLHCQEVVYRKGLGLTGLPPQRNSMSSATSSASAPPVAALLSTLTPLTWGARVPSAHLAED